MYRVFAVINITDCQKHKWLLGETYWALCWHNYQLGDLQKRSSTQALADMHKAWRVQCFLHMMKLRNWNDSNMQNILLLLYICTETSQTCLRAAESQNRPQSKSVQQVVIYIRICKSASNVWYLVSSTNKREHEKLRYVSPSPGSPHRRCALSCNLI